LNETNERLLESRSRAFTRVIRDRVNGGPIQGQAAALRTPSPLSNYAPNGDIII